MSTPTDYPEEWPALSLQVKLDAGFRCVRCGHPNGRWSQAGNDHEQAVKVLEAKLSLSRIRIYDVEGGGAWLRHHLFPCDEQCTHDPEVGDHRILTVHHFDGVKKNLAWWNLLALDQRCHLTIQGKVNLHQGYQLPHSTWVLPYVAGYYAQDLMDRPTRAEVESDLVRYLILGQPHLEELYIETLQK